MVRHLHDWGLTLTEIAQREGVTQSAISHRLRREQDSANHRGQCVLCRTPGMFATRKLAADFSNHGCFECRTTYGDGFLLAALCTRFKRRLRRGKHHYIGTSPEPRVRIGDFRVSARWLALVMAGKHIPRSVRVYPACGVGRCVKAAHLTTKRPGKISGT